MGSESINQSNKRPYDITMSKRTRKPLNPLQEANENPTKTTSPEKEIPDPKECIVDQTQGKVTTSPTNPDDDEEEEKNRKSLKLKQLMNGSEKAKAEQLESGDQELLRGRNSLGQHFTLEESQLQLVKQDAVVGVQGMKLKGMVSRYAKILGHLIKAKRENPRKKKPFLKLNT